MSSCSVREISLIRFGQAVTVPPLVARYANSMQRVPYYRWFPLHPPEWTLLFRAARIALPPNPVVSRFRLGEDGNPNPILPEVLAVVLAALKGGVLL
jgi:hypothetical protein